MFERTLDRVVERLETIVDRRYVRAPFGDAPLAPASEYHRLWAEAKVQSFPEVDRYEQAAGAAIDPAWFHDLALLTQVVIKKSDLCYQHGRLLYSTLVRYTRSRAHDHLTIVETGTARGFSALCLAKALAEVYEPGGAPGLTT